MCSVLVPITGFMALFAGMAMDAPDSHKSPGKWLFVFSMMAAPLALLVAAIFAWVRIEAGDYWAAIRWCLLGVIPFAVAMVVLQFNWFEKQ